MPDDELSDPPQAPGDIRAAQAGLDWEPPTVTELEGLLMGYEVLELVGRGGMGAVYKARQISLDRWVAIKILPPALWGDPEYAERFRNEARMMARLMHPGMVAVFDFGQTYDGQLYFVMEYVHGTDVARMLATKGILPPKDAVAIAAHVCDTLTYAHNHGVVHRDIKPANVMVDMEGRVKVADFGLAKIAAPDPNGTESTLTMGSPDYIAPECLVTGAIEDHRVDIYSLGVMLYEMLVGVVPRKTFFLPSDRVRGLDVRLNDIVVRAMQHDADSRYPTATEFRQDLNRILTVPAATPKTTTSRHPAAPRPGIPRPGPGPGGPRPPMAPYGPPPKKSGVPWGLVAALALLIAGGAAWYFVSGAGMPRKKRTNLVEEAQAAASLAEAEAAAKARETDRRLEEMARAFRSLHQEKIASPHLAAVADLDAKYLAALSRAVLARSSGAGQSDEVPFLLKEKERVEARKPLPQEDSPDLPESLRSLRQTYRTALGQIDEASTASAQAFYAQYDRDLAALEAELAKGALSDEVIKVRVWRRAVMQAAFTASLVTVSKEAGGLDATSGS